MQIAGLIFGLWCAACLCAAGLSSPAAAQSWFDNLFQPFQPQPQYSRPEPYRQLRPAPPRRQPHPRRRPVVERAPEKPAVPPSRFVAVIGDSLGQLLGQGLAEAFADTPDVGILRKARDSTGLVREDYFDWTKDVRALLDSGEKIDVAVMMIGSNDRQTIHSDGTSEELLTPGWTEAYAARVKEIAGLFRAHKVPLIWVGLPIMKSDRFSADMSGFNDIYREQATAEGATYIDIWEAFGDDKGQYSPFGPNIDGRIVRLRASDGVHFTRAGARKLAHFVEADVRRFLDQPGATSPAEASVKPTETPAATRDAVTPPRRAPAVTAPIAGPVLPLTTPAIASDGLLATTATAAPSEDATAAALIDRALIQGRPVNAKAGRADDHRWSEP